MLPIQYDFDLNGGRWSHALSFINPNTTPILLDKATIRTTAIIAEPEDGLFKAAWATAVIQPGTGNHTYVLTFNPPVSIPPGNSKVLQYAAPGVLQPPSAIGPFPGVPLPPTDIQILIKGRPDWEDLELSTPNPHHNPHPNFEVTMYHAQWGQYSYQRTMANAAWPCINGLNYSFVGFNEKGDVFSLDTWADQLELPALVLANQRQPYLNAGLSFGGWTNAGQRMDEVFSKMAADPVARQAFVQNAVRALVQTGADGIDIDWEYVKPADAQNFITLLQQLRAALPPPKRLTIAAPASAENIKVFTQAQWQQIANLVDRINVMTYDYAGAFSAVADFHAPWLLKPASEMKDCVEATLTLFKGMGVADIKICLGIPNYSRSVIVAQNPGTAGMYQPVLGAPAGDFSDAGGIYGWNSIANFLNGQPSSIDGLGVKEWHHYDAQTDLCREAEMSALTGLLPDGRWVVINYLSKDDAFLRANKAKSLGLGGVMMWANYTETLDLAQSLVKSVSDGVAAAPQMQAESVATGARVILRPNAIPMMGALMPAGTKVSPSSHVHSGFPALPVARPVSAESNKGLPVATAVAMPVADAASHFGIFQQPYLRLEDEGEKKASFLERMFGCWR